MRGLSLKLALPLRRSGAVPRFMPMMLATVKMMTPESADAFNSTRICTGQMALEKARLCSAQSLLQACPCSRPSWYCHDASWQMTVSP